MFDSRRSDAPAAERTGNLYAPAAEEGQERRTTEATGS